MAGRPDRRPGPTMKVAEVLDFERIWWHAAGSKDEAIRSKFDLSPVRYYQQLNQILDGTMP
ncbi:DUF3263 domain-containing protein [Mycobacteroides abscessus]|uniref:DUF3263 domain-containing protein n=1 Tax=Mycobacteroides abscessus TaxID=36809 RepID=UPI00373FC8EE